jgi:hypothetical protein
LAQIKTANVSGCDLQTVARWFYLLRKHGYKVSPGNKIYLYTSSVPNYKSFWIFKIHSFIYFRRFGNVLLFFILGPTKLVLLFRYFTLLPLFPLFNFSGRATFNFSNHTKISIIYYIYLFSWSTNVNCILEYLQIWFHYFIYLTLCYLAT